MIVDAVQRRTDELMHVLRSCSDDDLRQPSALEGWTRLTIVCHLRYGAAMTARMTRAAVAGRPTTFYPGGRGRQRPLTLRPAPGETITQVVESVAHESAGLATVWVSLDRQDWERQVVEPDDRGELQRAPLTITDLALLRLTEVEVHGTDLALGARDWSAEFIDTSLPRRLASLGRRRPPRVHEAVDPPITWLLAATDGPSYAIHLDRHRRVTAEAVSSEAAVDHRIEGSRRDLLALLLGRRPVAELIADPAAVSSFRQTFPGP